MDLLKKAKSYVRSVSDKSIDAVSSSGGSAAAALGGHEVAKLGAAGKYIRMASSAGIGRTSPILAQRVADAVCIVYFLLGTGFLLPWNAFITAVDYFGSLYPDSHVDRIFSVAYLVPCLAVLALLIAFGQQLRARTRINWGLGLFFLSIIVVPIMGALFISEEHGSAWTYVVTVCAVAVAGIGDALVQGTLIGFAGHLPERYTQAIVSGTGFSGVLVSLLRIGTKQAFPDTNGGLRSSANVYFSVGAVFLVVCVLAFNAVHGIAVGMVCKYGSDGKEGEIVVQGVSGERWVGEDAENGEGGLAYGVVGDDEKVLLEDEDDDGRGSTTPILAGSVSAVEVLEKGKGLGEQIVRWKRILGQVKWLAMGVAVTYVITLAIFPGFLTEDVTSASLGDWYPVLLLGCYNLFDLVGKSLPATYVPSKQVHGFGWAAGRLLFFPLYSACVHGPRMFRTEAPVFVLTGLLGLTNGYLTTCFFLVAPKSFKSGSLDAETAGVVMVLALEVGLTLGSLLSWVWVV